MDYERACHILKIDKFDHVEIKKKYRIMALKYHPDKCRLDNANELFLEVNEAYNYLVNHKPEVKYDNILDDFLREHFDNFHYASLVLKIINNSFLPYVIENSDIKQIIKIYNFLNEYKELFNIDEAVFSLFEKRINMVTLILNPSIQDLLESNVFMLNYKDDVLTVPLWHKELCYELNETVKVLCIPDLSDNIMIDLSNNIHIMVGSNINEEEEIDYILGSTTYKLSLGDLDVKKCIKFVGVGINSIEDNIFSDNKMDILFHFN